MQCQDSPGPQEGAGWRGQPLKGGAPAKAGPVGGASLSRWREKAFLAAGGGHTKARKQEPCGIFKAKD